MGLQSIEHVLQVLRAAQLWEAGGGHLVHRKHTQQASSMADREHTERTPGVLRVCVRECVRACVRACVCACVRVRVSDQGQQVEEEARVLADQVVGLRAEVHKELEAAGGPLAPVDDVGHVGGQDKGGAVSEGQRSGHPIHSRSAGPVTHQDDEGLPGVSTHSDTNQGDQGLPGQCPLTRESFISLVSG